MGYLPLFANGDPPPVDGAHRDCQGGDWWNCSFPVDCQVGGSPTCTRCGAKVPPAPFDNPCLPTEDDLAPPPEDKVVLPPHYARFAIEPLRYAMENGFTPLQAKIAKYTARYDSKNGLEDIGKGVRCCIMLMRWAAADPDWWKPDPFTPQIIAAYGKPYEATPSKGS